MLTLSEPGLYFLGCSDKPKALPYQKWTSSEYKLAGLAVWPLPPSLFHFE